MPGASRVGIDSAGGPIIGPGASTVKINGKNVSVKGDGVTPHPPIDTPHYAGAVMVGSSSTVKANGKFIVRAGDSSSCGHSATGSGNVNIG